MNEPGPSPWGTRLPRLIVGVFLSALFLAASFPNPLLVRGFGFLAWLALVPLFVGLLGANLPLSAVAGFLFGALLPLLSETWLGAYSPVALALVASVSALQFALLLPLVGLCLQRLPSLGPAVVAALWTGFEYLRSRGDLAFPFGQLGLTQYGWPFAVRCAALGGVWLLSFLVALTNGLVALMASARMGRGPTLPAKARMSVIILACLVAAAACFSLAWRPLHNPGGGSLRLALVQHGHGRQEGLADYRAAFGDLRRLTDLALEGKPDLVVWPESAIVPSINWHLSIREDRETLSFIQEADSYASGLGRPLLFGNDLAEIRTGDGGIPLRLDRNAAILRQGAAEAAYTKTRLVPFAEEVPPLFAGTALGKWAKRRSAGGWERGEGPTPLVLHGDRDIAFGSPICFEDGFGDYARAFAARGARFLVVLTSDAWSGSAACEYQHLSQSVFRSAETGLPVARAASTGISALVLPDGHVVSLLKPFTRDVLVVDLPLLDAPATPYLILGDLPAIAALLLGLLGLGVAASRTFRGRRGTALDGAEAAKPPSRTGRSKPSH
jgi:apolipoprotein N-acyltransferase